MIKKTYIPAKPRNKKLIGTGGSSGISSSMSGAVANSHTHANKAVLDLFKQDSDGNVYLEQSFYSMGGISALGLGESGSGGGGGEFDRLDAWVDYDSTKAGWVLSALLGKDLDTRVNALQSGSATNIEISGVGNAVTGVSKDGNTLTFAKGSTFSLSTHNHDTLYKPIGYVPSWSEITNKPSTFAPSAHTHTIAQVTGLQTALDNKEPIFTKNTAFNKNFGTTAGTVAQGNDSRILNGQTAFGWGNHASAGYALNSALTAHTGNSTIHITATERTNWNDANSKKHTHSNKALLDLISQSNIDVLNLLSVVDGNIKVDTTLWATGGISALGLGSGGGSGDGGVDMLDSWANYTTAKADYYVPASLLVPFRNDTLNRLTSLESGSATSIVTTGSGNAITSLTKSGSVITANKGLTFALASHSHTIAQVTGLQGALDLKATPADITTAIDGIEIGGRNLILNSLNRIGFTSNSSTAYPIQDEPVSGENYRRFRRTYPEGITRTDIGTTTTEFFTPEKSGYYTYSIYFRPNEFDTELIRIRFVDKYGDYVLCKAGEWTQVSVTTYIEAGVETRLGRIYGEMPPEAVQWIDYNRVSVTSGNKATDWTPAPEDQVSDWNETDVNSFSYIKNKPTQLSQFTDNIGVTSHITNTSNPHSVTKAQVGLGNVDDTSDANKPISTATQTALNLKAPLASPTFTGNVTAPTFIGDLTGNASSATQLQTAITIAGVSFDGSTNIDIPFDNLASKPTTLGGYGITDAVTTNTTQSITGAKTFTIGIKIGTHSTDGLIEWDATNNAFKFNGSVYATGGVSALGLGEGGGGSGGGVDMLDAWANYTTAKANFYVPANLLVPFRSNTLDRLNAIEGGLASAIATTGAGNAITSVSKSGNLLTFNKGLTFSLSTHNHDTLYKPIGYVPSWGEVTGKPSTFAPSAHTHTIAQITGLQGALDLKASQSDIDTAIDGIEIGGRNLVSYRPENWEQGGIAGSTGEDYGSSSRMRTVYIPIEPSTYYILTIYSEEWGQEARLHFYDDEYNWVGSSDNTVAQPYQSPENASFIKFQVFKDDQSTITPQDATSVMAKLEKGNKATDWTPAPEDQVTDWNVTDVNSFSYIKNKPTQLSQFTDNIGVGSHIANTSNPHSVTKAQVGLGNVDNVKQATKSEFDTHTENSTVHITSTERTNWNDANSKKHEHSNKAVLDLFKQDSDGNVYLEQSFYSMGGISALGLGEGGSGGGVDMLDSWANYTTAKANYYVPASLLVPFRSETLNRLNAIEGGSATSITTTGTGNAITSVSKVDNLLTFNKGLEFSLSTHTHTIAQVTGLQGALDGKQPTISTGVTSQYYRGDKTWQALNTSAVSEGTNLYFTNARVKAYGDTLYSLLGHTHTITQITGLQGALDLKATQSDIDTAIDNIDIGGSNLLPVNTGVWERGAIASAAGDNTTSTTRLRTIEYINVESNQDYYISIYSDNKIVLRAYDASGAYIGDLGIQGWITGSVLLKTPPNTAGLRFVLAKNDDSTIGLSDLSDVKIKVEKGNKATDWTPTPEDQVTDWNETDATSFSFIKNKPTTLAGYGITDAVTLNTAQTITGAKTFSTLLTASAGVNTPKVDFGNGFTIEPSGTELVFKHNGVIKQRMLSDGTILATAGITALSTE